MSTRLLMSQSYTLRYMYFLLRNVQIMVQMQPAPARSAREAGGT